MDKKNPRHERLGNASRGVHITTDELASRSLLSPACGLGSTTIEIAEQVFDVLAETSDILKKG